MSIFSKRKRGVCTRGAILLSLALAGGLTTGPCWGGSYTVAALAAAMTDVQAQVTDIKYHFNTDFADDADDHPAGRLFGDATLEMKKPEGWLLNGGKSVRSTSAILPREAKRGWLVAFDGKATFSLDLIPDSAGRLHADIIAGYDPQPFNGRMNPDCLVWGYAEHLIISQMLTKPGNSFIISAENERIDGIDTIKLVGSDMPARGTTTSVWVAPGRGFLPLQSKTQFRTGMVTWHHLSKLLQIGPHAWYPQQISFYTEGLGLRPNTITIDDIKVDDLAQKDFQPALPPGTHVVDFVRQLSFDTPVSAAPDAEAGQRRLMQYMDYANGALRSSPTTRPSGMTGSIRSTSQPR